MIQFIDIRRPHPDGPAVLGELIAQCPVIAMDGRYETPTVDIQLPDTFTFPREPTDVVLYADNRYFGRLLLTKDGLVPPPDSPSASPYFKIIVCRPTSPPD